MVNSDRVWASIQLRHLKCFVAVAQTGSLKRAGAALALSVPAISKTLSELEEITAQTLVRRLHSGAELTPTGQMFFEFASVALRGIKDGCDAIGQVGVLTAVPVVVGALPNVAATVLPVAMSAFLESLPQAKVRVITGTNAELLSRLAVGELDFVVGRMGDPAQMLGLTFEQLYTEPLVFIAKPSHPIFSEPVGDVLGAVLNHRLILPFEGTHIRRSADIFLARHGVSRVPSSLEALSTQFASTMLLTSDAIWLGPLGAMEVDILAGRFKRLPIDTESTAGPVGLTLRSDKHLSAPLLRLAGDIRAAAADRRQELQASLAIANGSVPLRP